MKKGIVIFLSVFTLHLVKAQHVISSTAYIQTCVGKTHCFSEHDLAYIFYDDNKNELILKIDFPNSKENRDTIANWMDDLSGTAFYFIGNLKNTEFAGFTENSSSTLKIEGSIYFNGVWQTISTELILFTSTNNSLLTESFSANAYDAFKVNFGLSFLPKDFKIHKGAYNLKKVITIGVAAGRINQLKPDMRDLLKDIEKRD